MTYNHAGLQTSNTKFYINFQRSKLTNAHMSKTRYVLSVVSVQKEFHSQIFPAEKKTNGWEYMQPLGPYF